jgi:fused signal recognition particle receptor
MGIFEALKRVINKDKDYEVGLSKTRSELKNKLSILNNKYKNTTEEYFEELEELLISADIGIEVVIDFIERLKKRIKIEFINDASLMEELIVDELFIMYVGNDIMTSKINFNPDGPTVILFVGVNGVGKTTTIAKMGNIFKDMNKKVLMIAGDTFRAGAIEQIQEWGSRLNIPVFKTSSTDPSSVIFDGLKKAREEEFDVVLIDTAGRLQNKEYLMQELLKMNKVIKEQIQGAPHEVLLVLDATTGQNGISQAKIFKEITNVTGIVLTKLDGTAKGGIVLSIRKTVGIPVKYIGLGEKVFDLKPFDIEKYIYSLIVGGKNE